MVMLELGPGMRSRRMGANVLHSYSNIYQHQLPVLAAACAQSVESPSVASIIDRASVSDHSCLCWSRWPRCVLMRWLCVAATGSAVQHLEAVSYHNILCNIVSCLSFSVAAISYRH